ncbi:DUF2863 family protein [Paenalcaligenes faecalis]|uniref:DUF2863 family protein n=1 Tax=Paenalcaligenes faecalis TaxID=2980099 RepID=UPI0022B9D270|nr:DUF2863 family protein [Paenalcaligenes faecalis]
MVDSTVSTSVLHHKAHDLLALIEALNQSGSRLEDHFWEAQLSQTILDLLADPNSTILEQLLDYLATTYQSDLYDILASLIEGMAESATVRFNDRHFNVLLVTAPIATWTRYQLPDGVLSHTQHEKLLTLFKSYAGSQAKVAVLGQLLSFDQLPKSVAQTHELCTELGLLALEAKPAAIEIDQREDGISLLADTKFIVTAIAVPEHAPVFAWQESPNPLLALQQAQQQWQTQCEQILSAMFAGCQSYYLPPDGYFYNNRESDKQMRPLAIKAAAQWLSMVTDSELKDISAVIARCGAEDTEEFRIGLGVASNPDILYGCVWPIFSRDEIDISSPHYQDTALILQNLLSDLGIESIQFLAGLFDPDFCDDCSAPSFPNAKGELQHPYLPEDMDYTPSAIH